MRSTLIPSMLAVATTAVLVAGVTLASAQGMGGGTGGSSGSQHMRQGPTSGGSGPRGGGFSGSHQGPRMGMQGRTGGHPGGFSQSHGPSYSGGGLHTERGHAFGTQRSLHGENLGVRGRSGTQTGALHSRRGQALAEQRRLQGQNLKTTSRTGTKTGITQGHRDTHAFAQAGTRSRISLSSQQRTRIQTVALHRNLISRLRVTNVNFDIRIGVVVPRSFHLFVVPEDIVVIVPRFRHFRCFVFDDELVIVDPFTFEIVAIIPV
jgi:hypothetical protein